MRSIHGGRIFRVSAAVLLAGSFSISACLDGIAQTDTCTVKTGAATPDIAFDQDFTQNGPGQPTAADKVMEPSRIPGWNGGDSVYSLRLPNGETAFFFSDSYIGQAPPAAGDGTVSTNSTGLRTRAVNCPSSFGCYPPTNLFHAHNSIVIRSVDGRVMRTIAGPLSNGYSSSYFVPSTAGHMYWVGDSVLINVLGIPKVLTFLFEWDASLHFYGTSIAQLSVPSLKIETILPITNDPSGDPVHWGVSAFVKHEPDSLFLYIYGIEDYVPYPVFGFYIFRMPHVARVKLQGLAGIADTNHWEVYNRTSGWISHNLLSSSRIIGDTSDANNANDSIGEMFTVKKVHSSVGTSYLLVSEDTNPNTTIGVDNLPAPPNGPGEVFVSTAKEIVLYSACSPEGPWSAKQGIYATPETQATTVPGMISGQILNGHLWTYNPAAHPQFNWDGGLLISYSLNSDDNGDLIYADAYRPKFIRVPIDGLLPDFQPEPEWIEDIRSFPQ